MPEADAKNLGWNAGQCLVDQIAMTRPSRATECLPRTPDSVDVSLSSLIPLQLRRLIINHDQTFPHGCLAKGRLSVGTPVPTCDPDLFRQPIMVTQLIWPPTSDSTQQKHFHSPLV